MTGIKMGGYHIPTKTRVFINAWAIRRDPNLWKKPQEFLPERFMKSCGDFKGQDFQFIPFGIGRRGCPGMSFGVAATEYVIANFCIGLIGSCLLNLMMFMDSHFRRKFLFILYLYHTPFEPCESHINLLCCY